MNDAGIVKAASLTDGDTLTISCVIAMVQPERRKGEG
jgi:hypothetical protein